MKKKNVYLIILFLITSSFVAFGRIVGNDFINFDEIAYIIQNDHIKSGINAESVKWAFTTIYFGYWHPVTWLSHMLDWKIFGANAGGHHLTSLLFHIGAVIFLFLFLKKTTNNIWSAAFAAAFFALHPLRVESVAWAAERKDVLSMFFCMATLYAYAFYVESPKPSKYLLCMVLFTLALMSKPTIVTLPFALMLLDYWPLGRWQETLNASPMNRLSLAAKLLWEKVYFILLTIIFSILIIWTQDKQGALASIERLPLFERIANAIISYFNYLEKIICPANMAVFYPYNFSVPVWKVSISFIVLVIITIAVIDYIKKLPFLFVGWFWYLGTLVPLIGLIQAGQHSMADRHTYMPSVGIALMLAWGIPYWITRIKILKNILFPAAIAVLASLAFLTWVQCGYWKNSITLFSHALYVTKDNYLMHNNLGLTLSWVGKDEEAIYHYNEAIHIKPKYFDAYFNRSIANFRLGQSKRAIEDLNKTILLKPNYADAYYNRGVVYSSLNQHRLAIESYNEAIRLKPNYAAAYNNRSLVYINQKNEISGCLDAKKACELGVCLALETAKQKGFCY
jgi:protein O-mannosyl-transferase